MHNKLQCYIIMELSLLIIIHLLYLLQILLGLMLQDLIDGVGHRVAGVGELAQDLFKRAYEFAFLQFERGPHAVGALLHFFEGLVHDEDLALRLDDAAVQALGLIRVHLADAADDARHGVRACRERLDLFFDKFRDF